MYEYVIFMYTPYVHRHHLIDVFTCVYHKYADVHAYIECNTLHCNV